MKRKMLLIIIAIVIFILIIPFVGMQFYDEVNWSLMDFVIAGILLLGTGFICEFIIRKVNKKENRIILILNVLVILLLIWAELAVGIFGTPLAGS